MPGPLLIPIAIGIGKIAGEALIGEMVSRGLNELEELYKRKRSLDKQQVKDVAAIQHEEMAIEEQTVKASIAGYNDKKKAQEEASKAMIQIEIDARRQEEERIKAEGKEFDDNMKKKEEAFKNLAEFDERMRISSLDGEAQKQAQLLANYEKQKAEIEAMHEAQLLYAEDDMALKEEQYGRLLDMETTYQAERDAISKEFAGMEMLGARNRKVGWRSGNFGRIREKKVILCYGY